MIVSSSEVYLGLDVGDVRIGVALSRSGFICEPIGTIERKGRSRVLDEIEALVKLHKVTICVIGLPLLEKGVEGEQAEKTRAFGRSLVRRIPALKLAFQDERYTSGEAKEMLGSRAQKGTGKGSIDRMAAAIILQAWLDEKNSSKKIQGSGTE